jgi:amidase
VQQVWKRTATELVSDLADGSASSRALLEELLERVARHNPKLNAVVTLDAEGARARADESDAMAARGVRRGSLHGLPMTIKDSLEVAGLRTTSGSIELAEHVSTVSSPAVALLERAGAVVFGKTNTPEFAGDWQTDNEVFGRTSNPWDQSRTSGGSSGGAAVAVATAMSPVELGTDLAGSIRVPASFCGVYGHKPSFGIVPGRGHDPGPPGRLARVDLGVIGPLGRSADDLELMLSVLAAPAGTDARAWTLSLPPPRRGSLKDYRVAVWPDDPACSVDDAVAEVLASAVEALASAGAGIDDRARPVSLAAAARLFDRLQAPVGARMTRERFARLEDEVRRGPEAEAGGRGNYTRAEIQSHWEWLEADEARARLRAGLEEFFESFDVLLCPVVPVAAFPHDSRPPAERTLEVNGKTRSYFDLKGWMGLAGAAYLPATVAPAGFTSYGLPVGVQIIGAHLEDRTTIDFARRLAWVVGGFVPPPAFA